MSVTLADLLRQEKAALLAGDIDKLADLSAEIERCLHGTAAQGPSETTLRSLRASAAENERLLDAARRGLEAAMNRLKECRTVAQGLTTYGADGALSLIEDTAPTVERRA